MTQEQIEQAAIERGCIKGTAEYYGFIEGAEYALRVCNDSQWHDAKKDPPQAGIVVAAVWEAGESIISINAEMSDEGVWFHNGLTADPPTYWMPIPKLQKGGAA